MSGHGLDGRLYHQAHAVRHKSRYYTRIRMSPLLDKEAGDGGGGHEWHTDRASRRGTTVYPHVEWVTPTTLSNGLGTATGSKGFPSIDRSHTDPQRGWGQAQRMVDRLYQGYRG